MRKARTVLVISYIIFLACAVAFFVPWKITYSPGLGQPQKIGVLYKPLWYQTSKADLKSLEKMDDTAFMYSTYYGSTIDFAKVGSELFYATFIFIILYFFFSVAKG